MLKQQEKLIPINTKLLNKYESYNEIFQKEKGNKNISINSNIPELENIDINNINVNNLRKLARIIFHNYHKIDTFINDGNLITVTNNGINESIQKLFYNSDQKTYLLEHLKLYSKLGLIIEKAKLINQVYEKKNRKKYIYWNYYICNVQINSKKYKLELEIASLNNLKNNYRIHRITLK